MNVKYDIRMVICAVLVYYMSSQKGEFTFPGPVQYNYMCLTALVLEENILLVIFVHKLSLTVNIYD